MKRLLLALLLLTSSAEAGLITPPGVKGNSLPSSGQCNFATSIASDGTLTCTSPLNLYNSSAVIEIANEGTTGTGLNQLAKLIGAPSTAIKTGTGDTAGIEGIVVAGNGTTGNAQIARAGQALCAFDGATTAGDYVQNSPTVAGDCHDTGSSAFPTSGQVMGRVLTTHVGAGSYLIAIFSGVNGIPATGMTTSGSNASSTAVAADWVPDGPGTRLLGSAANGWSGIYLVGDATSNGVKIVAAPGRGTSNVMTVPTVANATFAFINALQTWTSDQTYNGINAIYGTGSAIHFGGNASAAPFFYRTPTNQLMLGLDATANYWMLVKSGNEGYNWSVANQTTPTLVFTGSTQNNTHVASLTHNDTDFVLRLGTGAFNVGADIISDASNTRSLGSSLNLWANVWATIYKSGGVVEFGPRGNYVLQIDDNGSSNPYVASAGTFIRFGSDLHQDAGRAILQTGVAFASLGAPSNGTIIYCTDCQQTAAFSNSTCTNGGNGALAIRLNGAWKCEN